MSKVEEYDFLVKMRVHYKDVFDNDGIPTGSKHPYAWQIVITEVGKDKEVVKHEVICNSYDEAIEVLENKVWLAPIAKIFDKI